MRDEATNVLHLDRARDKRGDKLRAAIVDETLELASREIDRIAGDLRADPHDVCCSLMLALLRRIAREGDNPYDDLDWLADSLKLLNEAKEFQPSAITGLVIPTKPGWFGGILRKFP